MRLVLVLGLVLCIGLVLCGCVTEQKKEITLNEAMKKLEEAIKQRQKVWVGEQVTLEKLQQDKLTRLYTLGLVCKQCKDLKKYQSCNKLLKDCCDCCVDGRDLCCCLHRDFCPCAKDPSKGVKK